MRILSDMRPFHTGATDMDPNEAIEFAQLVNAVYAIQPTNLANSAGAVITAGGTTYTVVTTIYAFDLATDVRSRPGRRPVSMG